MSKFKVERYVVSIVRSDSGKTRVAKTKIPCCCCCTCIVDLLKQAFPYVAIYFVIQSVCGVFEKWNS